MDEERAPGGDLKLGVIVQHVAPGVLQRGLEGVLWQHGVHVLHSQVGRGQDVGRTVHLHDGRRVKGSLGSGEKTEKEERGVTRLPSGDGGEGQRTTCTACVVRQARSTLF